MTINKKWISDISRYNTGIVNIHIIYIIYDINTFSLTRICGFYDPNIFLWVVLLEFLIMCVKFSELIRKNVSVGYEIEILLSILFLHADHIVTKSIFSRDFVTLREMIDLLIFIETFVEVALAWTGWPKDIPLVRLSMTETVCFEDGSQQFIIKTEHFIEKLGIFNMVRFLTMIPARTEIWMGWDHLIFFHIFELNHFIFSRFAITIDCTGGSRGTSIEKAIPWWRRCSSCGLFRKWGPLWRAWSYPTHSPWICGTWAVLSRGFIFEIFNLREYLIEAPLALFLLDKWLGDHKCSLFINEVRSTNSTRNCAVYAIPLSFKIGLNLFQSVQCAHLLLRTYNGALWRNTPFFLSWPRVGRLVCRGIPSVMSTVSIIYEFHKNDSYC